MYTVFLCGGIASGKSTVSRVLAGLGAHVIDLDEVSREVTRPGEAACAELARAFGADVLDDAGALRRGVLASRAFATSRETRRLEAIMHPHIRARLARRLEEADDRDVVVVEIPLLDRVEDLLPMADEVICVTCPVQTRRARAVARGMDENDFDRRVSQQASDAYMRSHATVVMENEGDEAALRDKVDAWWRGHSSWEWSAECKT